jgi:PAS domain-containing protein
MHEDSANSRRFALLSNHGHALLTIAESPDVRLREIAERIGITDRATQSIVNDLVAAGYVQRTRRGRRNTYTVDPRKPFTHPSLEHGLVGSMLSGLVAWKGAADELVVATGPEPEHGPTAQPSELVGDESLDRLASLVGEMLNAPVAFLALVDRDSVTITNSLGIDADLVHRELTHDHSIARAVVESGAPVVFDDVLEDPVASGNRLVSRLGVKAGAAVPLASPDGVIAGCLCVADTRHRRWVEADMQILTSLAAAAAAQISARVVSRGHREAAERYRMALDNLPETVILVLDRDLRIQAASGGAMARAGVAPKDVIGRTLEQVSAPSQVANLREHYEAGLDGLRHSFQHASAWAGPLTIEVIPVADEHGDVCAVMAMARAPLSYHASDHRSAAAG